MRKVDRGAGVDDQLPSVAEIKNWAGDGPNRNHGGRQKENGRFPAEERGLAGEKTKPSRVLGYMNLCRICFVLLHAQTKPLALCQSLPSKTRIKRMTTTSPRPPPP